MRSFRRLMQGPAGRVLTIAIIAASIHAFSEPQNYLFAYEVQQKREADIRAIAARMNVDPEFLLHPEGRRAFDFRTFFASLASRFGLTAATTDAPQQPLDIAASIARVKSRYALVAADTTLARIAELVQISLAPDNMRGKKRGQIRSELQSLLRLIDKDFLPQVDPALPGIASARDARMRQAVNDLRRNVKSVIGAPHALDDANIEATLTQLRAVVTGSMTVRNTKPRWTNDHFPLQDTYRAAPVKPAPPTYGSDKNGSSAISGPGAAVTSATPSSSSTKRATTNAIAPEVSAAAAVLKTPAKIFTWVHDNIDWESYSGVAKSPFGTLSERRGNDWDQAILLRDMLASQGYDARLEWGTVSLPIARAMNLVGTEDPTQAANLLATAGFNGIVLTANNVPVAIQMTHAWVRAFIPYIPNRGASAGTPDTWVRMDPSFKKYDYQPGIAINGKVSWSEDEYLQTSAVRPPADFYGDKIWSYIRANNLNCQNLAQVAKSGSIHADNFPFVPSTLTARIESAGGFAADAPADQLQTVALSLADANGAQVASYNAAIADLWGKKLTLTFPPATADDAAIINSYGGLFNTPAYLINLKPVFSIDDVPVAEGQPVAAGAALDLNLTFTQPNVVADMSHHQIVAGETHTEVFDAGNTPDSLIDARMKRLAALTDPDAALSEKLFLIGLRYMQHVDDGLSFSTGVRWQRGVKRVFEGDVRRQIDISYNIAGAPLRLTPAENNIDVSRLLVGVVPINNDLSNRAQALQLAGLESSYREASIWDEMEGRQGISAVKALLLARIAGKQLYTVTSSNVDSVLNTVDLPADVESEIRGSVAQGRIAKIAASTVQLNRWSGAGYILEDPLTGAATYPISGGFAGGSDTDGAVQGIKELLGSESWLTGSPLGDLLNQLLALLGGGGAGSNGTPSTTQSDPVNLSSGNMYRSVSDLSVIARGIPVSLSRTYNSRSTYNGPFGYGWTFNYGEMIVPNGDGSVTYRESDGTEHYFALNGGAFVSPAGKHLVLTSSGSGYTMQFKDGTQFGFDANGFLVSQRDLNGNVVTINRDPGGNPASVVDASGRTVLTFVVTSGKITTVNDVVGGRSVVYAYNGDDLVSVTDTANAVWTYAYDLDHNMTSLADPLGNAQSYDYDSDDRLMHHVDATGAEEYFQYDIAGRQSVITDKRGGDRFVTYDDSGRATLEADPAGNVVKASFDADNNRTGVIDSRGNTTAYEYDPSGNVTKQVNPDGGTTLASYDSTSRPLTSTDALGVVTTNVYDTGGNLTESRRTVSGVTETTSNVYDSHGQLQSTTDPNGAQTSMMWSTNGALSSRTDAAQNTTTITTDPAGRITSLKDVGGNETKLEYDGKDRITKMTDPYSNATSFVYDAAGRRTSVTNPRGTTLYTYDAEGRVLTVTDPLGDKSLTAYDPAGDVVARTDARGNTTRYEYDLAGRVTKMTDANGGVWTYGYCAALGGGGGASCSSCGGGTPSGSFCQLTDPNGNTIKQDFDVMGRVVSVTDSLSHAAFTQYDKAGRKTVETDANGNATRFGYDEAGRLVSVNEASGAVTLYTYDKNGNKLAQKDANGNVWSYEYDALNRLTKETDPLQRSTSYTYDTLGNLATKKDANGKTTTYAYNIRRLTGVTYEDGTADTFTYDALGRRTGASNANVSYTYTYDTLNRLTSVKNNTVNVTTTYSYDAAGNRTKMVTPYATTAYTYDAKNRLTTIDDSVLLTFRFGYDPMDRRTSLQYPNGLVTSYAYDKAYRLTALATKDGQGNVVDAWSYQYDAVGNRTSKTDMNGAAEIYTYDNVYRLTSATYGAGSSESFTYDAVGNRLTRTNEGGGTTTYAYDVANELKTAGTDALTYDNNGNMIRKVASGVTTTATYNQRNLPTQLATPSGNETNTYGPNGERATMSGASIENRTVAVQYDLTGNPIADHDLSGTPSLWTYRLYGPGIDECLGEYRRNNNRKTYQLHDALGSVTAVANDAGQVAYRSTYKAFGDMSRSADATGIPQTRLGYTSREMSVGGLMQYRSRYYDSGYGRFLQQDSYAGAAATPPSLHRYAYVINNPVDYTDPTGRAPWIFQNLADLANALTLPKPTIETIYWAALDFLGFFAALLATNPMGAAPLWLTIMGIAVLTLGIGIGAVEIYLDSNLGMGGKMFLFGLWVAISFTMYFLGNGIFAMLLAMGGTAGLANAPSSAILAGTMIVALTSYTLWLVDQAFTSGLEIKP